MRFRTLEIRWHDSKPISSCDFQPAPTLKKARPPSATGYDERWASQNYRLATAGEDNHVRIWMVYPNIRPTTGSSPSDANLPGSSSIPPAPLPPRVEYLATLARHSAAVNVVRWSPNGELLASAGDDGMIIIWAHSSSPQAAAYGSDLTVEEQQNEKEFWRVRCMVRCTTMQVYDVAWSPTGEYIIAGSTDNAARIFQSSDGKCVHEIAEHNHYVQGVSWDPLNEYVATQSSDRSMHVYRISTPTSAGNKLGTFEVHAIGKNTNFSLNIGGSRSGRKHARTSSTVSEGLSSGRASSRPGLYRRESTASDAESAASEFPSRDDASVLFSGSNSSKDAGPLTPATSVASTPSFPPSHVAASMFPPPPIDKEKQSSSRRSSFSGSNAPSSPAPSNFSLGGGRYGRSPSPMPALPAIRTAIPSPRNYEEKWKQMGLYGDESYTNFFRRLTFSPDGGLLVTPAGQFEDPEVIVPSVSRAPAEEQTPTRGRKVRPSISTDPITLNASGTHNPTSCVYIYTRSNFARPPVAQLPGYKKPSVAVRFSPVLFDLRPGVSPSVSTDVGKPEPKTAFLETGNEGKMEVDVLGSLPSVSTTTSEGGITTTPPRARTRSVTPSRSQSRPIAAPAPRSAVATFPHLIASPVPSPIEQIKPPTPAISHPGTPTLFGAQLSQGPSSTPGAMTTASVFALPYRMLFAVVTMDTVAIYDTQQSGPFCMLTKLHYDEFTDVTWSPDGQCLLLSSRDGYCTLVTFDEIISAYHTQQQSLQLQSIAHQHSVPLSYSTPNSTSGGQLAVSQSATPVFGTTALPAIGTSPPNTKRPSSVSGHDAPLTPAGSVDGDYNSFVGSSLFRQGEGSGPNDTEKRPREEVEPTQGDVTAKEPPKKKRRVALTRVGDVP